MNKEILRNILILDSIYRILKWNDRVRIHLLMQDKISESTENIQLLYDWCLKFKWLPPKLKYGQDRLQYYENSPDEWILTEELKHIKLDLPCLTK
ncbi:hypothetical protein OMO38_10430 [Chryseobacterium sp. 09-1422]|uniref:Uncharacterized protein n=1 Tax=Chryseobacterium kimseyorum TaxID=2984028 RepID=A0ABT3HZ48_9FLAO|nr:hypothetical protein [Chryseobacterium kimseyorum]MCW3168938.1 hypothetical protein [Chryseobacterium kimseyorum]